MPAAAVIPAPIAYINVAAVKKLVVGFVVARVSLGDDFAEPSMRCSFFGIRLLEMLSLYCTVKKVECSTQVIAVG